MDRWSLELQGRNIHVEHIPGYKNKAADCLSRLPFVTRKRNDNPLKDEETTIKVIEEENDICCPLCEVDLTDTQTLQKSNTALGLQNCLKILKVDTMKGTLMGMMIKGFYTMLTEKMGGNTKQQYYQRHLLILSSKKCMTTLAILVLVKLIHLSKGTTSDLR